MSRSHKRREDDLAVPEVAGVDTASMTPTVLTLFVLGALACAPSTVQSLSPS